VIDGVVAFMAAMYWAVEPDTYWAVDAEFVSHHESKIAVSPFSNRRPTSSNGRQPSILVKRLVLEK
jgi:hypothetical protein